MIYPNLNLSLILDTQQKLITPDLREFPETIIEAELEDSVLRLITRDLREFPETKDLEDLVG